MRGCGVRGPWGEQMQLNKLTMAIFASVLALSACGDSGSDGKTGSDTEKTKLRIAWVPKALNNVVFETGRDGALLRAKEINSDPESDVEIEVIYQASEASDAKEQAKVIDQLVADGIDGLGVSCNDTELCGAAIDRAVAAGVEVMTWDSDAPTSKRFTYYSVDNHEGGIKAAQLLGSLLEGKGKVAMISGNPMASNLNARIKGFEDELAKSYPNMEVVTTVYGNDDTDMSAAKVEEVMKANPDLKGWFFVGLWSLLADNAKTATGARLQTPAPSRPWCSTPCPSSSTCSRAARCRASWDRSTGAGATTA